LSAGRDLLKLFVVHRLPYHDPLRRRRVRAGARSLVTCSPWPGESANADQVAQLALLRLLALQREARKATRHRLADSAALAARNSIETYLVGMYCLHGSEVLGHLNAHNARAQRQILRYLPDALVSRDLVAKLVTSLGRSEQAKTLPEIAKVVDAAIGGEDSMKLYEGFYAALSTYYSHGRGLALLRQVGKGGRVTQRPRRAWSRRSPTHLADALVAQLAAQLSERPIDAIEFSAYAEAHRNRVVTPIFFMGGGAALKSIQWSQVPQVAAEVLRLRKYLNGRAQSDSPAVRESCIRVSVEQILTLIPIEEFLTQRAIFIDGWVSQLAGTESETAV